MFTLSQLHLPQAGGLSHSQKMAVRWPGNTALPLANRQLPCAVVSGAAPANWLVLSPPPGARREPGQTEPNQTRAPRTPEGGGRSTGYSLYSGLM